jgi:hypothetical protein
MSEFMGHAAVAFGSASTLFKTIKEGANAIREAKNLELYGRMLAVHGDVIELVEKNRGLAEENRTLKEQLKTKESLTHDGERYWIEKDDKKEGPFCHTCWDIDVKLVRLRSWRDQRGDVNYVCDFCRDHRPRRR